MCGLSWRYGPKHDDATAGTGDAVTSRFPGARNEVPCRRTRFRSQNTRSRPPGSTHGSWLPACSTSGNVSRSGHRRPRAALALLRQAGERLRRSGEHLGERRRGGADRDGVGADFADPQPQVLPYRGKGMGMAAKGP
ncbi:hypothetical protein GCM10025734_73460 [Kitasatospora paranensis]